MQSTNSNITWINFWIEFIKIIGPASVALIGTYIALRFQRIIKEKELDAQMRLKARELMFSSYQKKADTEIAELKEAGKALSELELILIKNKTKEDILESIEKLFSIISTISVPLQVFGEKEIESELKHFNLLNKYEDEIKLIKSLEEHINNVPKNPTMQSFNLFLNSATNAISSVILIHNEILEKKREQLFEEYLPKKN